ncbi:MAG: extracellular solute-binding protein [Spirochaetales bacterium]|jgi:iron(III) transport system substrate-binding protein|nr:extracellular solute-binding protein [Spirochaetales bacterium]MBQ4500792.1 extracellular solute-binding protein [Spirochaetales bacterium]MBQ9809554.1 extracellular solute-binding protein [Spirochaetales bacterium]MBR0519861.1 extracellular solute-binding protein [Spirochaetales bacterium]MCR5442574.1 extracellular solute-binding protein [Sphaerochaetaceae bacterium]
MKKALGILLIALVAMTAIFAQAATEAQAGGSGELILYTTVSQAHYDIAIAKFNELYPNITVYYTYGGAGDCKARIQAEAANPQADAMFGGLQYADLDAYGQYFDTYVSKNDAKMQEGYHNTSGKLTFHDVQIPVMVVNDALEAELGIKVTGWASLLDPKLYGKVVMANPTSSSSAWNNLQCLLTDFGGWDSDAAWDYIAKLMSNGLVVVSSSSVPGKSTLAGEYAVGLSYEPAIVKLLDAGTTGGHMVYWEEGVTSVGFASAIIKGAKNLENAKLFMDFLQSDAGQQSYLDAAARPATTTKLTGGSARMVDIDTINYKVADTEALAKNKQAICDKWNEYWAKYGKN